MAPSNVKSVEIITLHRQPQVKKKGKCGMGGGRNKKLQSNNHFFFFYLLLIIKGDGNATLT